MRRTSYFLAGRRWGGIPPSADVPSPIGRFRPRPSCCPGRDGSLTIRTRPRLPFALALLPSPALGGRVKNSAGPAAVAESRSLSPPFHGRQIHELRMFRESIERKSPFPVGPFFFFRSPRLRKLSNSLAIVSLSCWPLAAQFPEIGFSFRGNPARVYREPFFNIPLF